MKKFYILLFTIYAAFCSAQPPANYYSTATGSGYTLKTQLYNIIKGHTDNGYAGLYVTYETSDIDKFYENDGSVLDMYSENPTATDSYNYSIAAAQRCGGYSDEGDCYNREHIIPQSVFDKKAPMVSDAHFITPTDGKVNGIRSNYPHSIVATASSTSKNGSKLGQSTTAGYTGLVFEPIDEFKGDIARMYFYFATRYENTVAGYSYGMFNGTSDKVFTPAFLSQLIAWHNQDPVSPREIARNNAIYARQNNRNPYIDHPEYVASVWAAKADDTTPPTAPLNLTVASSTSNSVTLTWSAATDNVAVTSYAIYVNSVFKQNETGLSAAISGLAPSTTYSFYVIAKDGSGNASTASTTANGITTASSPISTTSCGTESFANIPATSPSSYNARTWTGDSGLTWTAVGARTDETINTKAICIRNGSLTASSAVNGIGDFTITTQLKYSGTSGSLKLRVNGNIVGTIPYSTTVTTTTIPGINISGSAIISITDNTSTTNRVAFDDISWTCYSTLNNKKFNSNANSNSADFSIYPNPAANQFTINFEDEGDEPFSIAVYSLSGKKVFEKQNTTNKIVEIQNLEKGTYVVKITKNSKILNRKLVIN